MEVMRPQLWHVVLLLVLIAAATGAVVLVLLAARRGSTTQPSPAPAGAPPRAWMRRFLISFDDGTMQIPRDQLAAVGEAAHRVVRDAKAAGVWVHGGGVITQGASVVGTDGSVTARPDPETKAVLGGFAIVNVPTREAALDWAARFAVACRCPQEVRELMPDPEA